MSDKIVAVGFLTERDLSILGQGFRRIYRLDDSPGFQNLLDAIDRADQENKRERPSEPAPDDAE